MIILLIPRLLMTNANMHMVEITQNTMADIKVLPYRIEINMYDEYFRKSNYSQYHHSDMTELFMVA